MAEDYKKLGLKAGLEVHQQLDTGKLFCRDKSVLREDKPNFTVRRYIRPTASEMGEFDAAALEQTRKGLTYIYEGYNDSTCEVETDSAPPQPIDKDALKVALEVALMAQASILDEMFVMRKLVADGSNTSSFQRTMLVAVGGKLKLKNKEVGVQTIVLEEDAARPMEKRENEIVYRLDRLGIPLIEFATNPELFSPEEVKECALAIGALLRRTGRMKRGLGTIRQDLNISISEGARVEIKGVQEVELIDEYVRREVERQRILLAIREELKLRRINESNCIGEEKELANELYGSDCKLLKGKKVFAVKLNGFKGLLGQEVQPNRRFGTEISSYVKARSKLKGIFHTDELPGYGISAQEKETIERKLGVKEKDAFVLVFHESIEEIRKALNAVKDRALIAVKGVPEETRNALEDGNTEYSRPLPGAARMYPETDLETIAVDEKILKQIRANLPLTPEQRKELFVKKFGLSEKLAEEMKLSNYARFYRRLVEEKKVDAKQAAVLLLEGITKLKRDGIPTENISNEMVEETMLALKEKKITQDVLLEVLGWWAKKPRESFESVLKEMKVKAVGTGEVENIVKEIVRKNMVLVKEKGMQSASALMGDAMKELKGKASGQEINALLKKEIEKVVSK